MQKDNIKKMVMFDLPDGTTYVLDYLKGILDKYDDQTILNYIITTIRIVKDDR